MRLEGTKAQLVYLSIRDDVEKGLYAPGARLPSEQKLMDNYQLSRVTIRRALNALREQGIICKLEGRGGHSVPYDAFQPRRVRMDFNTLLPQVVEMGESTEAKLLSFSYDVAPAFVAEALDLEASATVQVAVRVRLTENMPFSHLTTYVPECIASKYSERDLAATPLYLLLERSGVQIESAQQSITAALASPMVADALEIEIGSPVLCLQRIVRDETGKGVEFLQARYRPDLFSIDMSLSRLQAEDGGYWQPLHRAQA